MLQHATSDEVRAWSPSLEQSYRPYISFERRIVLINNLTRPIGIATRDGIKFNLPPENNIGKPGLVVRISLQCSNTVRDSIVAQIAKSGIENSRELRSIYNQWRLEDPNYVQNVVGNPVYLEYVITVDALKRHGGKMYIKDIDMVVSLSGADSIGYHPYSREAALHETLNESIEHLGSAGERNYFTFAIQVIDNLGQIGKKYLRIGDAVLPVNTSKDPERPNGFHVVFTKPVDSALEEAVNFCEHYTDAKEVPLVNIHDSYEAARAEVLSDEATLAKIRADDILSKMLESENRLRIAETARDRAETDFAAYRERAEHEAEKNAHDRRVLELDIERLQRERLRDREKDIREAVSDNRKSFAELLKIVPTVLLAVIGIANLVIKTNGK